MDKLIDLARFLPLSRRDTAAGAGLHVAACGIAAFSTRERLEHHAEVAVYDSAKRIHLSVWLEDGPNIRAGKRHVRVASRAAVAGYTPDDPWLCSYGRRSHHVGVLLLPEVLTALGQGEADAFMEVLRLGGDLMMAPPDAMTLRIAYELDRALHDEAASPILKDAKSLELLAHLLQSGFDACVLNIPLAERERLHLARSLLLRDLTQAPTIEDLARACGLNAFKLKRGFKTLFGSTVYGTFQSERMRWAWTLLAQTGDTVAEIGERVGYANLSHFAAAFRRCHGILPSEMIEAGMKVRGSAHRKNTDARTERTV